MRKLFSIMMVGLVAGSAPALADSAHLVTGNDYKPFTDEGLPEGGLVTDIVRSAYTQAGHEVKIEFLPWRRGEKGVRDGKYDATFPYVKNDEREKIYSFSDPVFVAKERPIVLKDQAGSINNLEDMKGKTLCMPIGYQTASSELQDLIDTGEVKETKPRNYASCFRMLKAGRVDFLAMERPQAVLEANNVYGSTDPISFENYVTGQTVLHLIFDKDGEGTQEKIATFNAALKALKDSGEYDKIVEKHL